MRISLLGLCICVMSLALTLFRQGPDTPSGEQLFGEVRAAYADLQAYSDVARVELTYDPVEQMHHEVRRGLQEKQGEIELLYVRGEGFLLDNNLEADSRLVVWDGRTLSMAFDRFRRYATEARDRPPTDELLSPFIFDEAFESHPIAEILLNPEQGLEVLFDGMTNIGAPAAETLKGRDGWRVSFEVPTQGHEDLPPTQASIWIGSEDHLIHELRLDQKAAQNAWAQRTSQTPYKTFVVTVTFLQVHMNPQIGKDAFVFEAPEGYERMSMPSP